MRTRESQKIEKTWNSFTSWNTSEKESDINQADVAKNTAEKLCNKFGKCDHFRTWTENDVSCMNCKGILKTVCSFLTKEDLEKVQKEAEKVQKPRIANDDLQTCVEWVVLNHDVMSRKAMVKALADGSARSEGGWKTMVGAVCLAMKHLENPGSGAYGIAAHGILNENITTFSALKNYVAKQEDKTVGQVGRSVQYVWTTWKNL